MAVQIPDFGRISFAEANPFLTGMQSGMGMVQSYQDIQKAKLANALAQIQNKYAEPNAQEALKHAQLQNQYYGPSAQSLIDLQKAQIKEQESLAGLHGVEAQQKAALMKYLEKAGMGGGIPNKQPLPQSPTNMATMGAQQYPYTPIGGQQVNQQPQQQPNDVAQQPNSSNMNFTQAALVSHLLGLPGPQITDVNGKKVAITPFGNFTVAEGLSPSQEAFQKGLGKASAEAYQASTNNFKSLQNTDVALDEMISNLDNPNFYNVVGPPQSFITKWAGSPQAQRLLGTLQSSSGEITLQIAPSLKGAFTGKDQTMINGIKANPNTDFPEIYIGKLKAQKLINGVLMERQRREAQYEFEGKPPLEAAEKAAKEVPLAPYQKQIDDLIYEKTKGKTVTIWNDKTHQSKTVTLEEAIKKYGAKP